MNEKDALEILKSESEAEYFKSFPENLKTDRNFILKAVKINGWTLEHVSKILKKIEK